MPGQTASPQIVLVGGPNGAGKTTLAQSLIRDTLGVQIFVNADVIAQGLSGFDVGSVAIQAGRVMLGRLKDLAASNQSFAFETTLASRNFASRIRTLRKQQKYVAHILFLHIDSADLAVERVAERYRRGGHFVSPEVVRRRYLLGLENLFQLYLPIADSWAVLNNSSSSGPTWVARGGPGGRLEVVDAARWNALEKRYGTTTEK
jgi:predicted ABC-type ATPase